jgi:coenzyme F420-reducing hydrogenase beta subunit
MKEKIEQIINEVDFLILSVLRNRNGIAIENNKNEFIEKLKSMLDIKDEKQIEEPIKETKKTSKK